MRTTLGFVFLLAAISLASATDCYNATNITMPFAFDVSC